MISFDFRDGLIFVPLTVGHSSHTKTFSAIVDTGSAGTAIDINLLRPDFNHPARFAEMVGMGGVQPAVIQEVATLALDRVTIKTFPIEFCDLENSFGVEAIIGNDLLNALGTTIDFPTGGLSFAESFN